MHERGFFNRRWPRPHPTVGVGRVKIHESVFTRIASAPDAYAPIVLPSRYAVVLDDGRIVEGAANPYETPEASAARGLAQEQAWDLVWWRRIAYFATVFVSAWLVARPFAGGPTGEMPPAELTLAARAILAVGDYVPDLASRWINYFATVPSELLLGGGVIVALMAAGGRLRGAICSTMRRIWIASTSGRPTAMRHLTSPSGFVYALRRQPAYQGAFAVLRRHVLPTVFGVGVLAMLVGIANRAPFEIASGMGTRVSPGRAGTVAGVVSDRRALHGHWLQARRRAALPHHGDTRSLCTVARSADPRAVTRGLRDVVSGSLAQPAAAVRRVPAVPPRVDRTLVRAGRAGGWTRGGTTIPSRAARPRSRRAPRAPCTSS